MSRRSVASGEPAIYFHSVPGLSKRLVRCQLRIIGVFNFMNNSYNFVFLILITSSNGDLSVLFIISLFTYNMMDSIALKLIGQLTRM